MESRLPESVFDLRRTRRLVFRALDAQGSRACPLCGSSSSKAQRPCRCSGLAGPLFLLRVCCLQHPCPCRSMIPRSVNPPVCQCGETGPVVPLRHDAGRVRRDGVRDHEQRDLPRVPDEEQRQQGERKPMGELCAAGFQDELRAVARRTPRHPPLPETGPEYCCTVRQRAFPRMHAQNPIVDPAVLFPGAGSEQFPARIKPRQGDQAGKNRAAELNHEPSPGVEQDNPAGGEITGCHAETTQ